MTSPVNIVILAAGLGKRMHSTWPKVLHKLGGRPLIAHVLERVRKLAPHAIVVVTGVGAGEVEAEVAAPDVRFARQDPPRGTGDATRRALEVLPDDGVTLVGLGDVPLVPSESLKELVATARRGKLGLLTARVTDPCGLGRVLRSGDERVRAIVEDRDATAEERAVNEINTGFMAAPTRLLVQWVTRLQPHNAQAEYYLTDIVAMAIADRVEVVAHVAPDECEVLGVNDRAQLAALERIVQAGRARALMESGTTLADPARIEIRGMLSCGRDVEIDVGCVFQGAVRLGDGVTVGPYCVLKDVTVGNGSAIGPYSHLDGATVGANARVGPYARLRPGTALADDVHVGNFVEIKASTLGPGSKANHLAYIGDASVGARVNYGAGSITANYDGVNKHRTVIGDDVQIGSNSLLVAPVEVGAGATIGGGSTIAADAPGGELTVARARQVTVAGWRRPKKGEKKPVAAQDRRASRDAPRAVGASDGPGPAKRQHRKSKGTR